MALLLYVSLWEMILSFPSPLPWSRNPVKQLCLLKAFFFSKSLKYRNIPYPSKRAHLYLWIWRGFAVDSKVKEFGLFVLVPSANLTLREQMHLWSRSSCPVSPAVVPTGCKINTLCPCLVISGCCHANLEIYGAKICPNESNYS